MIKLLILCAGIPAAYAVCALALALVPVNRGFVAPADGVEIQLVSNGIHVDFLLPVKTGDHDWSEKLPRAAFRAAGDDSTHILFGWGSRVFYLETPTWAELKVSNVLKATLWPNDTVLHVQYCSGLFEADESCRTLRLSATAYADLCAYIDASFARNARGEFELLPGKGYGDIDNFYTATGSYHALNTCNSWTNEGLKSIGVRTALWSPFPFGILWQVK